MLGWIRWGKGRRIRLEQERILSLPLLTLYLPEREREKERKVRKGARLLAEHRVTRVLLPPEFEWWPVLYGQRLRPVDTRALRCALAPVWVHAVLKAKKIPPEQAILCLKGEREEVDMERVARMLCPFVRNLIIDVPRGGFLAQRLRQEFGMPILPVGSGAADLTVDFDSGPRLLGVRFMLKNEEMPNDCEALPLLSVLWETGRVKTEEIVIQA